MSEPVSLPEPVERPRDERADARDCFAASLRDLLDAAVRTNLPADELISAAETVDALRARLASARTSEPHQPHDTPFHPLSLVGGTAHPLAPQLRLEPVPGGVAGTVRLGTRFEGGPGLAHGGVLALLFDHAMGAAVFLAGHAAMTRALDVVYRAPTRLHTDLRVFARVDRVEERKVHVTASISDVGDDGGDTVTATATAVFVTLTAENVAQIFAG